MKTIEFWKKDELKVLVSELLPNDSSELSFARSMIFSTWNSYRIEDIIELIKKYFPGQITNKIYPMQDGPEVINVPDFIELECKKLLKYGKKLGALRCAKINTTMDLTEAKNYINKLESEL